ncbi:MAG: universal stress protein, partial [Anaerolineae bacterium]|nr:universal stress protein [Anaerolineae bacterium]
MGWDGEESTGMVRSEAMADWARARGRARRSMLGLFGEPPAPLIAFEDVRTRLRLFQNYYKGIYNIPLDAIVGSVDRYQDFTREFLPLMDEDAERWQRVARLQRSYGLPPIEVYKIGDVYFVKDGNHRVSVMRQLDTDTIEAHVWEYPTDVDLSPDDDIDDILVKAERKAFLEKTRLDETRPGHDIRFTAPGRYPELEYQIELYRQNLSLIDGYDINYEEAAATWYDMVYSLAAETIVASGLLDQFPGRTAADLYMWVYKHREEIARREGHITDEDPEWAIEAALHR